MHVATFLQSTLRPGFLHVDLCELIAANFQIQVVNIEFHVRSLVKSGVAKQ